MFHAINRVTKIVEKFAQAKRTEFYIYHDKTEPKSDCRQCQVSSHTQNNFEVCYKQNISVIIIEKFAEVFETVQKREKVSDT